MTPNSLYVLVALEGPPALVWSAARYLPQPSLGEPCAQRGVRGSRGETKLLRFHRPWRRGHPALAFHPASTHCSTLAAALAPCTGSRGGVAWECQAQPMPAHRCGTRSVRPMVPQKFCTWCVVAQPLDGGSFVAVVPAFRLSGLLCSRPWPCLLCMGSAAGWAGQFARDGNLGPAHHVGWRVEDMCGATLARAATHQVNVPHG